MTLLDDLIRHTQAETDRRQEEHHISCPECSHESSPKKPHCSFGKHGWHCFVCGCGGSLADLAERVGLETEEPYRPAERVGLETEEPYRPAERVKKERKPASWLCQAQEMVRFFESHPWRVEAWQAYKPVSEETIRRMRLGYGVLPFSRCKHPRLIVPVMVGTEIVGLRGRTAKARQNGRLVDWCDCGKWLAPAGTNPELYPLYNEEALYPGCTAVVVENPIDALLVSERTPFVGVATYSVSYWFERWTQALVEARPEQIVWAYDNDLPGNGGALRRNEFIRTWLTNPKHKVVPPAAGPRRVNELLQAGLPARLFDWKDKPCKYDIGALLMEGMA